MDGKQKEAHNHGIGTMSCDTLSLNTKEIKLRRCSVPWTHEVWAFGIANGSLYWAIWAAFLWCCSINPKAPPPGTMSVSYNLPAHPCWKAASFLSCFLWGMMFQCCFRGTGCKS